VLLCEEASLLHYSRDHFDITWYPAGFPIVEQGERATSLYLLLSGRVQVIREDGDGTHQVLAHLKPGAFFGQEGLAARQTCHAHVIAQQNVTCLVLSPEAPTAFLGRGAGAHLSGSTGGEERDMQQVLKDTTCIKVDPYLRQKVEAIAAHRSQFPIQPNLLPLASWQALLGQEYFVPVSLVSEVEPECLALQEAL
jgi:CRP-like cAMP-binding protein